MTDADGGPALPITLLFASTTGTAARFSKTVEREAFAAHISGFHFDIKAVELSAYVADDIERERLLLILLPTWSGGAAPAHAAQFCAHLNDLATDFRVSKDALSRLRYAIFGLGSSEYGSDWCRAASDLDSWFKTLSAVPLLPLMKGDDSQDMEAQFQTWRDELWPILCERFAIECGEDDSTESALNTAPNSSGDGNPAQEPSACCGGATTGTSCCSAAASTGPASSSQACCGNNNAAPSHPSADGEAPPRPWLPTKEWRRKRKTDAEKRQRAEALAARLSKSAATAAATSVSAAPPTAHVPTIGSGGGDAVDDETTEEDRINDSLLALGNSTTIVVESSSVTELDNEEDDANHEERPRAGSGAGIDMEDLGTELMHAASSSSGSQPPREMVTPAQRRALTKEGYKIIGSHSAVKLCRWTKAHLRGRGGCYKHSLYGIASSQCMEVTPSLACANKCTFCWRHLKNPVGTSWRWVTDPPEKIVAEAVSKHVAMIKELKGMPGVILDRLQESMTVKHCALSLVGEPIFYPHIGKLIQELHARKISTFLVTNAQFPDAIATLPPVTQLYVSVDAATKERLKIIDRPLFADYWDRFLACLRALRDKGQRTVYRLTLLKEPNSDAAADGSASHFDSGGAAAAASSAAGGGGGVAPARIVAATPASKRGVTGNMENVAEYAQLVSIGCPDFIELKGVTYCGDSPGSGGMTMANVPYHDEVKAFAASLCTAIGDGTEYGLASEHAHSCCVLLAKRRFFVDGAWHTHIDFEKFQELVSKYYATDGEATFSPMDFLARTPDWALFDAEEGGFDPTEVRWRRKTATATAGGASSATSTTVEDAYEPSGSGCG